MYFNANVHGMPVLEPNLDFNNVLICNPSAGFAGYGSQQERCIV